MSASKSKIFTFTLFLLLIGCATSKYQVLSSSEKGTELNVSPDRVLLECELLHDADEPDLSGFMIHVLDENGTVLTLVQGNTLDRNTCERRLKKIREILSHGKNIYLAGTGNLNQPRRAGASYVFPNKGTFISNGKVLGFVAIANEHGACYDAYSGEDKPCPRDPFPLQRSNP